MDIVKKTLDALAVLEAEGITVQQGWYDADIKGTACDCVESGGLRRRTFGR